MFLSCLANKVGLASSFDDSLINTLNIIHWYRVCVSCRIPHTSPYITFDPVIINYRRWMCFDMKFTPLYGQQYLVTISIYTHLFIEADISIEPHPVWRMNHLQNKQHQ